MDRLGRNSYVQQPQNARHRALASGLIVLLVAVSVLPLATHARVFDDPHCDPPRAADDRHRTLVLGPGGPVADAGQHCDVCHWLRSIRVFDPQPGFVPAPVNEALVSRLELVSHPDVEYAVSLAARAPPA